MARKREVVVVHMYATIWREYRDTGWEPARENGLSITGWY